MTDPMIVADDALKRLRDKINNPSKGLWVGSLRATLVGKD